MTKISGHFESGQPLSKETFQQLNKASVHMAATDICQQLYLSALDLELHSTWVASQTSPGWAALTLSLFSLSGGTFGSTSLRDSGQSSKLSPSTRPTPTRAPSPTSSAETGRPLITRTSGHAWWRPTSSQLSKKCPATMRQLCRNWATVTATSYSVTAVAATRAKLSDNSEAATLHRTRFSPSSACANRWNTALNHEPHPPATQPH